jgi:hypothetical protein
MSRISGIYVWLFLEVCECVIGVRECLNVRQSHTFLFMHVALAHLNTVTDFLIIKATRCTNLSNLFWNEILRVSDSSSVHHQELFTVHSAVVCVIHVCRQLSSSSRIRMFIRMEHPDRAATLSNVMCHTRLYTAFEQQQAQLSVQWITPDDGQRNCPKHVEFHFKIILRN